MIRRRRHDEFTVCAGDLEPDTAYAGPAVLAAGDVNHAVVVHLNGHLEPLDGHFHWYGRIDGTDLGTLTGRDRARLTLAVGGGTPRPATLGEQDPWGHFRISGIGPPPFPFDEFEPGLPIP